MHRPTDVLPDDALTPRNEYMSRRAQLAYQVGYTWDDDLDALDAIPFPDGDRDLVEDGYLDASAGRDQWHLAYCKHHGRQAGECGLA